MPLTAIEQAILETLIYFSVIDYPLTLLEIRKFLAVPAALPDILSALNGANLRPLVSRDRGLYHPAACQQLPALRLKRYRLAIAKMKRAKFWTRLIARLPYVKAVAVYSSLALKNSEAGGDIDLFIIAHSGRLWTARFFVNSFLKIFRLRPQGENAKDKFCASYFISEENLSLSRVNQPEYFLPYCEGATFLFVAGDKIAREQFFAANSWLKAKLPNWQPPAAPAGKNNRGLFMGAGEFLAGLVSEKRYKKWQWQILPQKYFDVCDGRNVILEPALIKLHLRDKRLGHYQKFQERLNSLLSHA
ncbi:MAG: hypothetical protein WCT16_03730 [Candidatus Buchananbacteria bacterium]